VGTKDDDMIAYQIPNLRIQDLFQKQFLKESQPIPIYKIMVGLIQENEELVNQTRKKVGH
jgi:hypothetical protein